MIPNPVALDESKIDCTPKKKFEESGISCSFVNNSAVFLGVFSIGLLLKASLFCVSRLTRANSILRKVNGYLGMAIFIDLFLAFELDLALAIYIELLHTIQEISYNIIGKMLACSTFLIYIVLIASIAGISFIKRKEIPEVYKKWEFLKENVRQKCYILGFFINEIIGLRDLTVPLLIVVFHNYPMLQLASTIVSMGSCLFIKILTFPYLSKMENICSIANDVLYCIILIEFIVLYMLSDTLSSSVSSIIGLVAIIQILLIVAANLLATIYNVIMALIEQIRSLKKKNTEVVEVAPSTPKIVEQESTKGKKSFSAKRKTLKKKLKFTNNYALKVSQRR